MTSREAALDQLERVESGGAYVGYFTKEEKDALDPRDRRQTTEYVAGVTRWKRRLDFVLAHFYRGELPEMEPALRQILRLGLYELLYMQTPPHAALNEAVNLAKRRVRKGAGGLANGVLRSIERARQDLPKPQTEDEADDLAVQHSHPTWMVRRWLERFGGEETVELLEWNNKRPTYHLRVNTHRFTREQFLESLEGAGVEALPSPNLDDFIRVDRLQPLLQFIRKGDCVVQDESGGLVVRLLDPHPGETILDGCAAPGGKALYAAACMQNRGRIVANDIHAGRLKKVNQAAGRLGVTIIHSHESDLRTLAADVQHSPLSIRHFDAVLVDAPCTGLGVLAKRADMRWHRSPENLQELADLQDELLDAASRLVKPGGRLVYGTCTIAPEENEDRVKAFLDRHPEFTIESASPFVPSEMLTEEGYFATLPQRHGIDGAFAARLRKND